MIIGNIAKIEEAAIALKNLIKDNPDCDLEITGPTNNGDSYFYFVALTQRIVKKGKTIGYVCYRIKTPKRDIPIKFSSYEIFDETLNKATTQKFHLDSDPYKAFKDTAEAIKKLIK